MNTAMQQELTVQELGQTTPLMKKAFDAKERAETRPRQVVKKISTILVILALAIAALIASLISIRAGLFPTADQQALGGLLLLLSLGVIVAANVGLVLTIWSAFVSSYLQSQAWKLEAAEATEHVHVLIASVAEGAAVKAVAETRLASDHVSPFPINQELASAVRKAVAKAGETEAKEMVTAFREAAGE